MADKVLNVLILCTGNSARSILGECLINRLGEGRFTGHSAGSTPTGKVHPLAVKLLREKGYDTAALRSKSWDEFAADGAPHIDFVFTVCDNAAAEVCPNWPGHPASAHWGIADPAAVKGTDEDKMAAFCTAYGQLEKRIKAFMSLDFGQFDDRSLAAELATIGKM